MLKGIPAKIILVAAIAAAAFSCAKGPKVIPKKHMEKIYREMFLADQWLGEHPEKRASADTSWFYEPIFEKYGYTVEDYRTSVEYYLADPKRFAEMVGRVADGLEKDHEAVQREIRQKEKIKHRADSIALAMKAFAPDDFTYYGDLFYVNSMTDRIDIKKNSKGVYFPVPVVEDTMYHGPELVIRDTVSAAPAAEESAPKLPAMDLKPSLWRE